MPPVFQKWSLRVPLGPPKAALRSPKGPQRAPQSPPRGPPGALGGPLAPPKAPPRPPQEHLRPPKGDKQKHKFFFSKTHISAQGRASVNRCTAFGMLLWPLLFLFCFLSFCFRCLWAPRSPFTSSLPVLAVNWLPPGSPKAAPGRQNVPFYKIKPMILQCRLFSKSGL